VIVFEFPAVVELPLLPESLPVVEPAVYRVRVRRSGSVLVSARVLSERRLTEAEADELRRAVRRVRGRA
jgi:hypothetical protein